MIDVFYNLTELCNVTMNSRWPVFPTAMLVLWHLCRKYLSTTNDTPLNVKKDNSILGMIH